MPLIIDIPLSEGAPLPYFDFQVPLESVTYTLQMRWNTRASRWYMDVLNEQADTVLIAGLKLVASWPLAAYITGRQPPGAFVVVDSTGLDVDPDLTGLGIRWKLLYYTTTELGL